MRCLHRMHGLHRLQLVRMMRMVRRARIGADLARIWRGFLWRVSHVATRPAQFGGTVLARKASAAAFWPELES
tara:strand:+ start:238 stop:456 length:219 start_codon:yes stop_codon:yes gene_type:complete